MEALKWLRLIPIVSVVSLIGCAGGSPLVTGLPTIEPAKPVPTDKVESWVTPEPPMYSNWLSPAKVTISNYHPGAMAEYPIKFHNAKETTTERKEVTTEANETIAEIPISSEGLYQADINNVLQIMSSNPKEQLQVTAYNKKSNALMISGFLPSTTRIISVTYKPITAYAVYFRFPDVGTPSQSARIAQDWVLIADPTLVMNPLETKEDMVSISMPSDAKVPDTTFEFWIAVSEISKSGGGAKVSIELVSRWVVQMKHS